MVFTPKQQTRLRTLKGVEKSNAIRLFNEQNKRITFNSPQKTPTT